MLILVLILGLIWNAGANCPPGLTPIFSNSNSNSPQTCTPQDSCSCQSTSSSSSSTSSSRLGAICQYSTTYLNYICCVSTSTQCGSNTSPQVSANGQVVSCSMSSQCANGYLCNNGICCPNTSSNTCQSNGSNGCLTGQVLVNGQCFNSVQIGQPCQRNEQCTGGSTCSSSICQCQYNYVNVNQQCVISNGVNCQLGTVSLNSQCVSLASPGQSCMSSSQCIDISICTNGICTCTTSYNMVYGYCVPFSTGNCLNTQTLVNNQCVLFSIVGETCIATNQCVGGSLCSSGTCQCASGYTAMYGYCISSTTCGQNQVAVNGQCYNQVQIGGSCTFSKQCSINNAVCTNYICVSSICNIQCQNSQVCVNNQCYNTVSPGFQCVGSQQCLSNSQCINNICSCPSGTQLLNGICTSNNNNNNGQCSSNQVFYNNQCWNTVSIGQQCQITQQCLGNSQCTNSFCQCPSGSSNVNGYCSGGTNTQCNTNQVLYNNQCWNTVSIGQQCQITQQCLGNSQCTNSFCQCPSGSSNVNGYCSGGTNTQCNTNQVLYNNQCWNTVSIGQQCQITQQCLGNSQCTNSFCQCPSGSSNVNGYCSGGTNGQCNTNQVLYNNQCWNTVSIGQQCQITQQCLGNSQCTNSYCQCPSGSTNVNGYCSGGTNTQCSTNQVLYNNQCWNTVSIGQQCQITQQCLGNSQCTNSFCQCPSGSTNLNGYCSGGSIGQCNSNQVLYNNQCWNTVAIGQQCQITQQCLSNSQCTNSYCQCPMGTTNVNGYCSNNNNNNNNNGQCSSNQVLYNNQCWNTVSIGQQCQITQQCLGNSQCTNSFCQCPSGSTNVNGYCSGGTNGQCNSNQVLYNNQCWNTVSIGQQCQITQQCLGNSQCTNSFCQCPNGSSNVNGQCSGTSTSNLCSTGQTAQVDSSGQPINCLVSTCPTNSFCQYSTSGQRYVCCRSNTSGKKRK